MENDSDYGGTVFTDDSNLTEMPYEESVPERNCHVPPTIESDVSMNMSLPMDIPHSQLDQPTEVAESLENTTYTDSLSSNDSVAAFIYRDQNKIWAQTEVELDEDENADVKLLENPAYIDSVTSKESQLISLLKSEYQDDNDDSMSVHESIVDESQGKRKEFEVSIVEIVPHISPSLQTEALWESTAYIDEFTCPSPSTRRLERVCKQAMLNLSQDISCKGSMKGSTLLPVLINQVPEPVQVDEESFFEGNEVRNLLVISVSVSMMNVAFSSLRNLQSSLNHEDGVGLYSLTGSCGAFTFMSLFTPSLIQQFRPKRCLLFALFTHLLYVAANVIPNFSVLVPASILQGGGSALMWNAVSTYVTYLARSTAIRNDKRTVDVAGKYFGVFFCFFQLSVVVGNLISSVVLKQTNNILNNTISIDIDNHDKLNYQTGSGLDDSIARNIPFYNMSKYDLSICGSKYCHSYTIEHGTLDFEVNARHNLLGIYGVSTVLSLILPLFLLDSLKNYRTSRVSCKHVAKQASSVLRCIIEPRFLSCLVMFLYSNMELGFVMAEVTKAFVTCPLGIHMVGYTMICFGVCGSVSSFVGGKIEKHVGCVTLIASATIIDLVLLAVMLVWQPQMQPVYYYFLLLGAWGVGDGIWMSQVNCVISRLFPDQLEEAFASLRVVNGLGITIGFAYASSLCMTYKMYILLVVCLVGTVIYVTSDIVRKCYNNKDEKEETNE